MNLANHGRFCLKSSNPTISKPGASVERTRFALAALGEATEAISSGMTSQRAIRAYLRACCLAIEGLGDAPSCPYLALTDSPNLWTTVPNATLDRQLCVGSHHGLERGSLRKILGASARLVGVGVGGPLPWMPPEDNPWLWGSSGQILGMLRLALEMLEVGEES